MARAHSADSIQKASSKAAIRAAVVTGFASESPCVACEVRRNRLAIDHHVAVARQHDDEGRVAGTVLGSQIRRDVKLRIRGQLLAEIPRNDFGHFRRGSPDYYLGHGTGKREHDRRHQKRLP